MDKELTTVDSILEYLEKVAAEKLPLAPERWVDAAMRLQSLLGNEMDSWYIMNHKLANARLTYLQNGMKIGAAKIHVEASDEYLEAQKQKGKIDRVASIIAIAKLRGRMASEEMRLQ